MYQDILKILKCHIIIFLFFEQKIMIIVRCCTFPSDPKYSLGQKQPSFVLGYTSKNTLANAFYPYNPELAFVQNLETNEKVSEDV